MNYSYEQFYKEATKLKNEAQFQFNHVFDNWSFALGISILAFLVTCIILSIKYKTASKYNAFLNWDNNYIYLIIMYVLGFISVIVFTSIGIVSVYNTDENLKKDEINLIYSKYMEQQNNLKLKIVEYTLDQNKIDNTNTFYTNNKKSYIFPNVQCENCKKLKLKYKQDKKDDQFTIATVLVSYSLDDNEKPYILTKQQIRESIAHIDNNGLYNPIFFVHKSEGGILE